MKQNHNRLQSPTYGEQSLMHARENRVKRVVLFIMHPSCPIIPSTNEFTILNPKSVLKTFNKTFRLTKVVNAKLNYSKKDK